MQSLWNRNKIWFMTKRSIRIDRLRRKYTTTGESESVAGRWRNYWFFPWISPFGFSEILQLDDPEERNTAGGQRRRRRFSAVRLGGCGGRGREMFLRIRRIRLNSHDRWVIADQEYHTGQTRRFHTAVSVCSVRYRFRFFRWGNEESQARHTAGHHLVAGAQYGRVLQHRHRSHAHVAVLLASTCVWNKKKFYLTVFIYFNFIDRIKGFGSDAQNRRLG